MLEFSATVREAKWAYKRNPHVYKTPKPFTFSGGDCLIYEQPDGTVNGYFFRNGSELTFEEPFSAFAGIDGGVYITVKQIEGYQFPRKTVYPTGLNAIVLANSDLYVSTEGIYTVLDYGEGRLRIFTEEDYSTVSGRFGENFTTLQEVYNSSPTGEITVSSGIGGMAFTDGTNDPLTQVFNINNFSGDNVFTFTPQSFQVREQPSPPAPVPGFAQLFARDVDGDTHLFGLDDAGNEFDLFAAMGATAYTDVVFFGGHGDPSNDGLSPDSPKDDIKDAIDAANLLPSSPNRKLVRGLDAGVYGSNNYNMTLDGDVDIDAPNATVQGRLVIRDNTKVRLHRLIDDGQGFPTINMNSGNNATYVEINEIDTTTTTTGGFAIRNSAADGVLIVSGEKLLIGENVVGAGDQAGSFGHIHLNFEDIYLFGDNAVALQSINSNASLVVIANHILKGNFTNTTAINATDSGSEIFVTTNEITADTAINVENGAKVYVRSTKIQGGITVGANSSLYIECIDHAAGSLSIDPTATVVGRIGNVLYGAPTFDEFPFTPSAPPSLDYQVANKKYVDDEIGLISTDLTVGSTPINNGTANAILYEGVGGILQSGSSIENISSGFFALTIGATTTIDCDGLEMVRRTLALTQDTTLSLTNLGTWTVLSLTVTNTSGSSWTVTLPSGDFAHPGQAGPFTVANGEKIELNALYNGSYVTWTASAGALETIA